MRCTLDLIIYNNLLLTLYIYANINVPIIALAHVNGCEEPIVEGEPHWHCNACGVVIIGEEDGVSLSSSKGNKPVNSQSSAAYSHNAYQRDQLLEKTCHLKNCKILTELRAIARPGFG